MLPKSLKVPPNTPHLLLPKDTMETQGIQPRETGAMPSARMLAPFQTKAAFQTLGLIHSQIPVPGERGVIAADLTDSNG